jgi:hypothetical protein
MRRWSLIALAFLFPNFYRPTERVPLISAKRAGWDQEAIMGTRR